ncbi:MAG TPA: hypothetical protein VGB83_03020 [Actinomycetota bacterium]
MIPLVVRLAALALVLSACPAETPFISFGRSDAPRAHVNDQPVFLIGDSLLAGASDIGELSTKLADDGWIPEVDAVVGRSTLSAIEVVSARIEVPKDVVVVLGTNPSATLGNFPDEIRQLIDLLGERGAKRILWIPPRHSDPAVYAERAGALFATVDRRLHVPDWGAVIDQLPELIGDDGLHLSGAGYERLATFIADELLALKTS